MKSVESSFLSQSIYSVSEDESGYYFVADSGETYWVYFTDGDGYAPNASFANNLKMVGFARQVTAEEVKKTRVGSDTRVVVTIVNTIYRLLVAYPELVIVYVCSQDGGKRRENSKPDEAFETRLRYALSKKRSEIFHGWFQQWQKTRTLALEKIDYTLYGQLHASCFFRTGHPKEAEIKQVIEQTIAEKQPAS